MSNEEIEALFSKMQWPGATAAEIEHDKEMMRFLYSATAEQKDYLCDAGCYNDTIKGYLIQACRIARNMEPDRAADAVKLTDSQIHTLLQAMQWALSENSKADADRAYQEFLA